METKQDTTVQTNDNNEQVADDVLVDLEKVSKIYKNVWAIKKVSLQIKRGEIVAFVGPNGGGKSTLGRLIANVIKQTSGIIDYYFDEENIFKAIGYQAKEQSWPNGFRAKDIIDLWINIYGVTDVEWVAKLKTVFGINGIENKYLAKLSSVTLELFAIFLVCLYKPELLIIDDLSSSVDFETKDRICKFLEEYRQQGNAVVLVYPDEYLLDQVVTRVVYIKNGRIIEDETAEDLKKEHTDVLDFVRSVVNEEDADKKNLKVDPFFQPIMNALKEVTENISNDYKEYFENKIPEKYNSLDAEIKNTIFYLEEFQHVIFDLATSNLSKETVEGVKNSLVKNKKNLDYMLKHVDKLKRKTTDVKHLSKLEKDIYQANKLLNTKLNQIFKNNKVIISGDELNADLEKDEKKRLKALKERYIKEELKIIRLESRKNKRKSDYNWNKKIKKVLTPEEQQIVDKTVAPVDTPEVEQKRYVIVLSNEKIVAKPLDEVKSKDIVLYDKREQQINSEAKYVANSNTNKSGLTDEDIYYDKTTDFGMVQKTANKKKNFLERWFGSNKDKK